jgi:hypothetical protein
VAAVVGHRSTNGAIAETHTAIATLENTNYDIALRSQ